MSDIIYWLADKVIKKVLQWFASALGALTSFLVQYFFWAAGIIVSLLLAYAPGILTDVYNVMRTGFLWISRTMWELWGLPAVMAFLSAMPDEAQPTVTGFLDWLNMANYWVPLDLGISLFNVWVVFHLSWASWFLIKRHIPAMGK